jgi:putative endonuclease
MHGRRLSGLIGEHRAAAFLTQQGYTVLAQNWRAGRTGELDLVAHTADGGVLVFVEVKARSTVEMALAAVDPRKQRQLIKLAQRYVADQPQWRDAPWRFDVLAVTPEEIYHVPSAFEGW